MTLDIVDVGRFFVPLYAYEVTVVSSAPRHMHSYEEQMSLVKLRQVLEERLEDYNMEPKLVSMQLVLFKVPFGQPGGFPNFRRF